MDCGNSVCFSFCFCANFCCVFGLEIVVIVFVVIGDVAILIICCCMIIIVWINCVIFGRTGSIVTWKNIILTFMEMKINIVFRLTSEGANKQRRES